VVAPPVLVGFAVPALYTITQTNTQDGPNSNPRQERKKKKGKKSKINFKVITSTFDKKQER
jgi:hypothetical protein